MSREKTQTSGRRQAVRLKPACSALAIRRTGNPYGITLCGRPYVRPRLGMRVTCWTGEAGRIVALRGRRDPAARIRIGRDRVVYLYQTALLGYWPNAALSGRTRSDGAAGW
jgi:hypothetical protein